MVNNIGKSNPPTESKQPHPSKQIPPINNVRTLINSEMPSSQLPSKDWWKVCESVKSLIPNGYIMRPLILEDYDNGYLECLGELTIVGKISREKFLEQLNFMQNNNETYKQIVIISSSGRVVACGTLLTERKFIHDCGSLAHIEDIVVCGSERGRGLGKLVIEQLKYLATIDGSYKITLDCDLKNEVFYNKSGFEKKGLQMCIYCEDK